MKSKDPKDNLVLFLLIFFGTFVGCVLTLASVLTFFIFYKKKLKKEAEKDVEHQQTKSKKKKFQNVLHVKRILNNKKLRKKNNMFNKIKMPEIERIKTRIDRKFKCQNNNTPCSNFLKIVKNTLKSTNSSSIESISETSFNEKNNIRNNSSRKLVNLKRFKPLCTSSPLLPLIPKSSCNTTFNLSRSITDSNDQTNYEICSFRNETLSLSTNDFNLSEDHSNKISDSEITYQINQSINELNQSEISVKHNTNKEMEFIKEKFRTLEFSKNSNYNAPPTNDKNILLAYKTVNQKVFDPKCSKNLYVGKYNPFNINLSGIIPMCCRKLTKSPNQSNNLEALTQTFNGISTVLKFCISHCDSLSVETTSDMQCIITTEMRRTRNVNQHCITSGFYSKLIFTAEKSYFLLAVNSYDVIDSISNPTNRISSNKIEKKISEIIDEKLSEKYFSFNFNNSQWFNELKSNKIYFQEGNKFLHKFNELKIRNIEQYDCNTYLKMQCKLIDNSKLHIQDNIWKGRSRKIKKINK